MNEIDSPVTQWRDLLDVILMVSAVGAKGSASEKTIGINDERDGSGRQAHGHLFCNLLHSHILL
jgi:hypothetical protein